MNVWRDLTWHEVFLLPLVVPIAIVLWIVGSIWEMVDGPAE